MIRTPAMTAIGAVRTAADHRAATSRSASSTDSWNRVRYSSVFGINSAVTKPAKAIMPHRVVKTLSKERPRSARPSHRQAGTHLQSGGYSRTPDGLTSSDACLHIARKGNADPHVLPQYPQLHLQAIYTDVGTQLRTRQASDHVAGCLVGWVSAPTRPSALAADGVSGMQPATSLRTSLVRPMRCTCPIRHPDQGQARPRAALR